jgi:hypothetical protein
MQTRRRAAVQLGVCVVLLLPCSSSCFRAVAAALAAHAHARPVMRRPALPHRTRRRTTPAPRCTAFPPHGPAEDCDAAEAGCASDPEKEILAAAEGAAADGTQRFTAGDYLSSLSRLADDGNSLLRAPQRYSSRQWRSNLGSIVNCRILRAVRGQLLWQVAWALLVSLIYIFTRGAIPTLPALPHSLLGGVMGVLLGFRTNQSYDRFWEGRKLWGQCFNSCRNLARAALVYLDSDKELYLTVMRHLKAFPVALKQHLRGEVRAPRHTTRHPLGHAPRRDPPTRAALRISARVRVEPVDRGCAGGVRARRRRRAVSVARDGAFVQRSCDGALSSRWTNSRASSRRAS